MDVAVLGHWAGVIKDFAAGLEFLEFSACDGDEGHAAYGAISGMIVNNRDVLGHRTDIEDVCRAGNSRRQWMDGICRGSGCGCDGRRHFPDRLAKLAF